MIEMDFKESRLEREIQYNGDWQIVFTTPCTHKFSGIRVDTILLFSVPGPFLAYKNTTTAQRFAQY